MANDLQTNLDIIDDFTQRLQVAVIGAEETTAKHEHWVEGTSSEVIQTINGPIKTLRGLIADWDALFQASFDSTIEGYDSQFADKLDSFDNDFLNYLLNIGFEPAEIYQGGITIERRSQTVAYDGVTYYWAGTLPFTTTGVFVNEADWLIAPIVGGIETPQITFATGGNLVRKTQSVLGTDGEWYFWTGSFPKTIPVASTLESAGGVGLNKFKLASGHVPVRPMMKILSTAAGFVLNSGSFEYGATITSSSQVLPELNTGRIWKWDGPIPKVVDLNSSPASSGGVGENLWNEVVTATGSSGSGITIGATKPTGVGSGHRWFCTTDGRTYVYFADGDSVQWVEESPQNSVFDGLEPRVQEALRRSYAEAGYNVVGTFHGGFTLVNANDVGIDEATGKGYTGPAGTVAAGTDPASGGFVDVSSIVAKRRLDIRDFGAVPGQDARAAILAGVAYATAVRGELYAEGEYLLSAQTVMRNVAVDFSAAKFTVAAGVMGFVIGGSSSGTTAETQKLGDVVSAEGVTVVPVLPTVRIAGTKGQNIEIKSTNYLQLYADNTAASDDSIAYSCIDVGVAYKLELTNNTSFPDGTVQWINENDINISRLRGDVVISGTYHHNHNRLNGLVLENGRTVDIQKGSSNSLDFVRFEGAAPTINFGAGTWNNTITQTWASNARAGYEPPVGNITDAGIGNQVIRKSLGQLIPRPVAIINAQQCKTFQLGSGAITSISGVQASVGGLFDFRIPANSTVMVDTGLLEMKYGEAIRFLSTKSLFRVRFYAYDSNKRQIQLAADAAHLLCNAGTSVAASGYLTQASNASGALAIIVSPDVKYMRVVVLSGTSTSGSYFDSAAVEILTNVGGEYPLAERKMGSHIPATASIPTAGFAAIGQLVKSTASDAHYRCTFSLLTAATSTISSTSITVDSASGVSVGDIVGIQLDDGTCHWSTVTVTSPLTIASAPPTTASAGNLVGFNRWI